jgi:hypothetical protein
MKGCAASNLGRSSIDERWRWLRRVLVEARQGTWQRHCRGGQLARAWRPGRSSAPNTVGKKAKQRGDHRGAHLGQQMARWVAAVAHGGGEAPLGPGDGGDLMRGSSGSKKTMGSFTTTSSSSSRLQLRQAAVNWWHTTMARVWFLWIKIQGK